MTELTSSPRCPDDDKMEALFKAREEEMHRLRMELDRESVFGKGDLIQILKLEMVELMEQDVALWQQLKTLEGGIASLRHDMIATRCRSNTFSSITKPDPMIYEGEGHHEIYTKPRSHTVTSSEEFGNADIKSASDAEHLTVKKPHGIRTYMKPIGDTLDVTNGKHGLFGMLSAFDFKSGLFGSGMNRLRNNVFLTGLNPNLTGFVEDLIKPSSSNQISPRRKLHRQYRVFELDGRERTLVKDDTNDNKIISIFGNENELIHGGASDLQNGQSYKDNNMLELLQTNENEYKDAEKISRDITHNNNNHLSSTESETVLIRPSLSDSKTKGELHRNREADSTLQPYCHMEESAGETQSSSQNEIPLADRTESLTEANRDTAKQPDDSESIFSNVSHTNELIDNISDSDDSDSEFTYLSITDGYVTCRIMTPGLEHQIRLKHETEGEHLDYLKYESGFARFISDSESCSSRDSYQSDDECSSEWDESDDDTYSDIFDGIKRLFDTDDQEGVSSISDAHLVKERNGTMPSISYSDTNEILEYQPLSSEELSTDTHGKLEVNRDSVDELNKEVSGEFPAYSGTECLKDVDDTNYVVSKEFTRETDYEMCVYRQRVCSFTFKISNRISSVDSGIGEDMNDSFENTD